MEGGMDGFCPMVMKRSVSKVFYDRSSDNLAIFFSAALILFVAVWVGSALASRAPDKGHGDSYIGITMQRLTDDIIRGLDLKVKRGVLVSGVVEGSPAEEAGIEDGDVIVAFEGEKVRSPRDLKRLVQKMEPGKTVKIELFRDNKSKTIELTVGEKPEEEEIVIEFPEDIPFLKNDFLSFFYPTRRLGVKVADLDEDLASYFDVEEGGGVLVLEVKKKSPAKKAGVKPGDVIVELDGESVGSARDLRDAVRELEPGENFSLTVVRRGKEKKLSARWKKDSGSWFYGYKHREIRPRKPGKIVIMEEKELREEMEELKEELERIKEELEGLKED